MPKRPLLYRKLVDLLCGRLFILFWKSNLMRRSSQYSYPLIIIIPNRYKCSCTGINLKIYFKSLRTDNCTSTHGGLSCFLKFSSQDWNTLIIISNFEKQLYNFFPYFPKNMDGKALMKTSSLYLTGLQSQSHYF